MSIPLAPPAPPTPEEAIQALPGAADADQTSPTPVVPPEPPVPVQPAAPSAIAMALGPLLYALLGPAGGTRRYLLALPMIALGALNHKLGLELSVTELGGLYAFVLGLIVNSTAGEASIAKSSALVQVAKHDAQATVAAAQATAQAAAS